MENLFIGKMHGIAVKARKSGKTADFATANAKLIDENQSYRSRGICTEKYKYFCYYEQSPQLEELYDLENDPLEQHNLIDDPKWATILQSLRAQTLSLHTQYQSVK